MALLAFITCGVVAFYTHRAEHGRTSDDRSAYFAGEEAGAAAAAADPKATLPYASDLNEIAQRALDGSIKIEQTEAWRQAWKQSYEHGYEAGFEKAHAR